MYRGNADRVMADAARIVERLLVIGLGYTKYHPCQTLQGFGLEKHICMRKM